MGHPFPYNDFMTNDNDSYIPLSQRTEAELIRQLRECEANMTRLEDMCEMSFLELTTLNALTMNRSQYLRELDSRTLSASV